MLLLLLRIWVVRLYHWVLLRIHVGLCLMNSRIVQPLATVSHLRHSFRCRVKVSGHLWHLSWPPILGVRKLAFRSSSRCGKATKGVGSFRDIDWHSILRACHTLCRLSLIVSRCSGWGKYLLIDWSVESLGLESLKVLDELLSMLLVCCLLVTEVCEKALF